VHNNRNTWPPFAVFSPFFSVKKPLIESIF
jgi:hypothetical protein